MPTQILSRRLFVALGNAAVNEGFRESDGLDKSRNLSALNAWRSLFFLAANDTTMHTVHAGYLIWGLDWKCFPWDVA